MVVGVRDEQPTGCPGHPQRMLQTHIVGDSVAIAELEEITTGERAYVICGRQRDRANDVGLAVGDEERAVSEGEAGRLRECGLVDRSISASLAAGARIRQRDLTLEINDPNLMRARHGDVKLPLDQLQVPR